MSETPPKKKAPKNPASDEKTKPSSASKGKPSGRVTPPTSATKAPLSGKKGAGAPPYRKSSEEIDEEEPESVGSDHGEPPDDDDDEHVEDEAEVDDVTVDPEQEPEEDDDETEVDAAEDIESAAVAFNSLAHGRSFGYVYCMMIPLTFGLTKTDEDGETTNHQDEYVIVQVGQAGGKAKYSHTKWASVLRRMEQHYKAWKTIFNVELKIPHETPRPSTKTWDKDYQKVLAEHEKATTKWERNGERGPAPKKERPPSSVRENVRTLAIVRQRMAAKKERHSHLGFVIKRSPNDTILDDTESYVRSIIGDFLPTAVFSYVVNQRVEQVKRQLEDEDIKKVPATSSWKTYIGNLSLSELRIVPRKLFHGLQEKFRTTETLGLNHVVDVIHKFGSSQISKGFTLRLEGDTGITHKLALRVYKHSV